MVIPLALERGDWCGLEGGGGGRLEGGGGGLEGGGGGREVTPWLVGLLLLAVVVTRLGLVVTLEIYFHDNKKKINFL